MKGSQKSKEDKERLDKLKMMQNRQKRWMEERSAKVSVEERQPKQLSGPRKSTASKSNKKDETQKEVLLWTAKDPELPPDSFVVRNKNRSTMSSARSQKSNKSLSSGRSIKKETSINSISSRSEEKNVKITNRDQYTSTPDKNKGHKSFKTKLDEEFSTLSLAASTKSSLFANDLEYDSEKYSAKEWGTASEMIPEDTYNLARPSTEQKPAANAAQFAMHCCPQCKHLMNKQENSPYLIIPCGHNICKRCLSMQTSCPTCHSKITSTLENAMLSQVIGEHRRQEERAELVKKEEQARKYVAEYDSLKTRYDVLSYKAESVIENMEEITNSLVERKSCMKEIEENGKELRNEIQRMQEKLKKYEDDYGKYNKECEELEYSYHKEKDNLDLLENTLDRVKQSKERVKTLIHNFIPSFKFPEDEIN